MSGYRAWVIWSCLALWLALFTGCQSSQPTVSDATAAPLSLPLLTPATLDGRPLRVVATTSIIGDVVAQVGGEWIDLTVLIPAGQDPHAFEARPSDLIAAEQADVILVNGWNLEESLAAALAQIAAPDRLLSISAGLVPQAINDADAASADDEHGDDEPADGEHAEHAEDEHAHGGVDPHVWLAAPHVMQWTRTAADIFSQLDPAHASDYRANRDRYLQELAALEERLQQQLGAIPPERRQLVTTHDNFAHFAAQYHFTLIGAIMPSSSTGAEPAAGDLAQLINTMREAGVCALFTDNTVNPSLSQAIAGELPDCPEVRIATLYTDALGPAGSGADSYIGMMESNAAILTAHLRP